jgi:hypothetical protein
MEIEDSVSYSQNPTSDLYPKPDKSSPYPARYILNTYIYVFSCTSQIYRLIFCISFLSLDGIPFFRSSYSPICHLNKMYNSPFLNQKPVADYSNSQIYNQELLTRACGSRTARGYCRYFHNY